MDFIQDWGLTAMVFAPLAGVAIMMLLPKDADDTHKVLALLTSLVTAAIGIAVLADFDYDDTGSLQFLRDNEWISVINSRFILGIDGLSVPLIALTLLITPLVIAYSWNHFPEPHNPKAFLSLILVLHTGMLGTFVAQDLILFFVFFEVVLLPMYFMIGVWGGPERQYASIKFFLYTLFGSALMLRSFLALFFLTGGETFSMVELAERVQGMDIARTTQLIVFGGMFMGFAIKVPMFPFHTWLPDAHTQAPTQGSVILAAVHVDYPSVALDRLDGRQETLAVEAIRVKLIRRLIGGRHQHYTPGEQGLEQPSQQHGIGDILDLQLIETQHPPFLVQLPGQQIEGVGAAGEMKETPMHPAHEVVKVLAPGRQLETRMKAVHQPGLSAPHRPPEINPVDTLVERRLVERPATVGQLDRRPTLGGIRLKKTALDGAVIDL